LSGTLNGIASNEVIFMIAPSCQHMPATARLYRTRIQAPARSSPQADSA
jgi:hypothetical protein